MKKNLVAAMFAVMMISLVGCGKASEPMPIEATEVVEEVTEEAVEAATEVEAQDEVADDDVAEKPVVDEAPSAAEQSSPYSYTELSQTMYAQSTVNVRDLPEQSGAKLGSLSTNQEVTVLGQCNETGWYKISYNGAEGFVSNSYLGTEKVAVKNSQSSSSKGSSQSTSQEAAAEAPASDTSQPEKQPGEVDTSNAVTTDQVLAPGETLAPDHHVCPICGFETDDANEYVTHLREVHNMQV